MLLKTGKRRSKKPLKKSKEKEDQAVGGGLAAAAVVSPIMLFFAVDWPGMVSILFWIMLLGLSVLILVQGRKKYDKLEQLKGGYGLMTVPAVMGIGLILRLWQPVSDLWYYGACCFFWRRCCFCLRILSGTTTGWLCGSFPSLIKGEVTTMRRKCGNRSGLGQWLRSRKWSAAAAAVLFLPLRASARTFYTDPDTGYVVRIEDDAGLLTVEEEAALAESMQAITAYGSVALKTVSHNNTTAEEYLKAYYREQFGTDSGIIFLIDMANRKVWLRDDGRIERTIGSAYLDTIADNCYRYASAGDYYACAEEVFSEIETLLAGGRIAQPMKYISNALLALTAALLINFCILKKGTAQIIPDRKKLLAKTKHHINLENPRAEFIKTTKKYSPRNSDSGGGSSSGGGGGGGGSSGGHSF